MKKLLVVAIILGGAIAFTSCSKKECVCTVGGTETTYTEDDMGGENVEDGCDALDAFYKAFSAAGDGCSIK